MQDCLESGLADALASLDQQFLAALVIKPDLNYIVAGRLIWHAQQYGPTAIKFALNAIAAESADFLHFLVSGLPGSENLRDTLFLGKSIQNAISHGHGIKKSIFRRVKAGLVTVAHPGDVPKILRSWEWMNRLEKVNRLPEAILDAPFFSEIYSRVDALGLEEDDDEIGLMILRHCVKSGPVPCL